MDYHIRSAPVSRWYLELRMEGAEKPARPRAPAIQAVRFLHAGFVILPIVAGIDKFVNVLASWDRYLAPSLARLLPVEASSFLMIVGVLEIAAGLLVAFQPRVGGKVLAAWFGAVIVNLLLMPGFLDVALRDFVLLLGALTLSRLARPFELAR